MIPILILLFLCAQISTIVSKGPTRRIELPVLDTVSLRLELRRLDRTRPFKMRWNQVKVKTPGGGFKIYTPWYLRRRTACAIAGVVLALVLGQVLGQYHLIPFIPLTAWVDGNTKAAPTADDMDGGGTDLASGDTVSLATKSLIIDKSCAPGAVTITLGNLTVSASFVYTQAGNLLVDAGTTSVSGTIIPVTYTAQFDGTITVNSGGVLGGNTAWTCIHASLVISDGGTYNAPNSSGSWIWAGIGNLTINGTFNNDGGLCVMNSGSYMNGTAASIVFYDVTGGTNGPAPVVSFTVQHTLTTSGAGLYPAYQTGSNVVITMGTASTAGNIVNSAGILPAFGNGSSFTVQSASASYPCICTGNDWNWDYGGAKVINVKWLDYQINAVTGGGGCTVNFTGNMAIRSWTTSIGDTVTTSPSVIVNQAASKTYSNLGITTLGANTVWNGASNTTSIIISSGTWNWDTCSFSKVDIQFTITTPGTGKTIALSNVTIDALAITALDTVTFSDYCISSAGFAIASNANLQINLNGHAIFVSNSTCSGYLIVYGSLLLDNSATVNTPGAHAGTITGTGAIQGVGTSVPYLYFTNMAVGARLDLINAVLVFDTSGASNAVGRNTVATDVITILAASTKTNLMALSDNAIEYGTRTFPEFFASQYKAGIFVGISRAPLDVDGMNADNQDALIGIEFQIYVMGHSPSKDQKLAVDLAEEIESELLADNHKVLTNGGTIITFSEFIKGPPVGHGDITLHFVLLECQYRKSTNL